jgi:O-acetyl-ADP-ribose deacetylase (regulator of RNase III)
MLLKIANTEIEIKQGDILSLEVDSIVNAANKYLHHTGGIAGQIVRKGGDIIQEESNKLSPIKTGEAIITSAGSLPALFVIHAVGPHLPK